MARRSPARVRLFDEPTPHLPGLTHRGRIALALLERDRFHPGAVSDAYQGWQNLIHDLYRRLFDPAFGCGYIICCPDMSEVNAILHAALAVLPPPTPSGCENGSGSSPSRGEATGGRSPGRGRRTCSV